MVRYYGPQERFDGNALHENNSRVPDEVRIFDDEDDDTIDDADEMGLDVSKDRLAGLESRNRWRDYAYEEYYSL